MLVKKTVKLIAPLLAIQLLLICLVLLTAGVSPFVVLALAALFIPVSWLFARRLVLPLGVLLSKARNPIHELSIQDLSRDEPEEWGELERALDRMRTDLTQKTEALIKEQEELSTLMSAISDAILAIDIEGKPLFFNSRFALLFMDREMQNRRWQLSEVFRAPGVLEAYRKVNQEGVAQKVEMPLNVQGDQTARYFSLSVAPLVRKSGSVYGSVGIFHDVTQLKRAEAIRIEFVANVSHELRTPLTAIKGYADTLRSDISANRFEMVGKFVDVISRNTDRLMQLIEDLLNLSSLESADSMNSQPKSVVETGELTERVLSELEKRASDRCQRLEWTTSAPTVMGQASEIEQILVNLVENAIKYSPSQGKIRVEWSRAEKGVELSVSDNGPGIPREHHARLFERFYRIDKARSRELGGTGLGLAIVKHIMQRHGGSVRVESEPEKGSTFRCFFPE